MTKETRGERERSEGDLDRGNVSATGCRLASEIQNWLLRRVGDVHAARNKPAGGCWWTNGGERSTQNGKEEKKSREEAGIATRRLFDASIAISGPSFAGVSFVVS